MSLFPTIATISQAFSSSAPPQLTSNGHTRHQAREELYNCYSVADDAKLKANQLSDAAKKELDKASAKVQATAGHIEMYSPKFYAACTLGGLLACGVTHTAVTPLDLVKCRRQVNSKLYSSNFQAWSTIARAEGIRGIFTGWSPTFFGYSVSSVEDYVETDQ